MTDTKHTPPELEAVELNGAWFVRTKPRTPDGTPEIVADLSMARHGKEWAALLAASPKMRAALLEYLIEVPIDEVFDHADKCKSMARDSLAAAEGRTKEKEGLTCTH